MDSETITQLAHELAAAQTAGVASVGAWAHILAALDELGYLAVAIEDESGDGESLVGLGEDL